MSRVGGPPVQMQTYGLRNRKQPGTRLAACHEVDCGPHVHGWRTVLAPHDPLTAARVAHIRNDSGRRFVQTELADGTVQFDFPAGQQCFGAHYVDTQTLYVVRDYRQGNARGVPWRKHSGPDPWVDEFATNQDRLAAAQAQG